MIVLLLNSC